LIVSGEEALGLPGGLEAHHDALAPPSWLMAVLRTIVQAFMLSMFDTRHDLSLGRAVAREFVGYHHTRRDALLLEQLAQ
jgi:hypothetical protein